MSKAQHWEAVYQTKKPEQVSWYEPHLLKSLELIQLLPINSKSPIIDIGAGASSLTGDLLELGYLDITALDLSQTALQRASDDPRLKWIITDITEIITLPNKHYDVWHDRAVFHFLIEDSERKAYKKRLLNSLKDGGYVLISTFGPSGPVRCSGLEVKRYSVEALVNELGPQFQLIRSSLEQHKTPFGTDQEFLYCLFHLAG